MIAGAIIAVQLAHVAYVVEEERAFQALLEALPPEERAWLIERRAERQRLERARSRRTAR